MEQTTFDNKLKPILLWIGTIVSVIMCLTYILAVVVLIQGFKTEKLLNTTLFSLVTALIGFCIMQMMKVQGQSFAKEIPENKEIFIKYCKRKTKKRKYRSMKYYWTTSVIKDVITKCATLGITSVGIVYIMIEGSGDYSLLFLAVVNLLMFIGFGLMALVKTYDFYNDSFVPYMIHMIEEAEKENEKTMEMAESQPDKQTNDSLHADRGIDILESCLDFCDTITCGEPLVLDNSVSGDPVLDGTIHSGDSATDRFDSTVKENSH